MTRLLLALLLTGLFAPRARAQTLAECASDDCVPVADFSSQTEVCVLERIDFLEEACKEDRNFYAWDFGDGSTASGPNPSHYYTTPGVYTVTLSVRPRTSCSVDNVEVKREIRVVEPPSPRFTISDADRVACVSQEVTFSSSTAASTDVRWAIASPENWTFASRNNSLDDGTITVRFDSVGNYRVRLTGANACSSETVDALIRVTAAPTFDLQTVATQCGSTRVTPESLGFRIGGDHLGVQWIFTQGSRADTVAAEDFGHFDFTESGTVSVAVSSACDVNRRSVAIGVQQPKTLLLVLEGEYCVGSDPATLSANIRGGRWSGAGITDARAGTFDPSVAGIGVHKISYSVTAGACSYTQTQELAVVASEVVTTPPTSFCANDQVRALQATPAGGSWSGPGILDGSAGTFDPLLSGPGTFHPVYTFVGSRGCAISSRAEVTVLPLPGIAVADTLVLCLADTTLSLSTLLAAENGALTVSIAGRELTGGNINPAKDLVTEGYFPLRYTYTEGTCTVDDTLIVRAEAVQNVAITDPGIVCGNSENHTLTTNLPGGKWSGPGIDALTGTIDPATAGAGTFTYTYVYGDNTPCRRQSTISVTLDAAPEGLTAGPDLTVCALPDSSLVLGGASPAGGTFSGPGLTNNVVDLSLLTPDSTYPYTYSIVTDEGCVHAADRTLRYGSFPFVDIVSPDTTCVGQPLLLAVSDPAAGTFVWDLGDGRTATGPAPSISYPESGNTYVQQLTTTTAFGCTDTYARRMVVSGIPQPDFVLDSVAGCAPFVLNLSPADPATGHSYFFSIDGDTLRGVNRYAYTLRDYGRDTTITVKLSASNGCGAGARVQRIALKRKPTASFGFRIDEGCSPFRPVLANNSNGRISTYAWDFGQGAFAGERNPTVPTFTNQSDSVVTYAVRLITDNECGRDTAVRQVSVNPVNVTAFISLRDTVGCQPYTLRPRSVSTGGSDLLWTVTDSAGKKVATSTIPEPGLRLTEPGRYRLTLQSTGCGSAFDTAYVTVLPAPEFSIDVPLTVCENARTGFKIDTTDLSAVEWNFGIAGRSTAINPSIVFDTSGVFTVTASGTSEINGCRTTARESVLVLPAPRPTPRIADLTGCAPLTTVFRPGLGGDSSTYRLEWEFGVGDDRSNLFQPTYTFTDTGAYGGSLTVTDDLGCKTTVGLPPIRVEAVPVAGIDVETKSYCGAPIVIPFANTSRGAKTYRWNFGDGQTSSLSVPHHRFTSTGVQQVQLIATSAFGCRDTATTTVTVLENPAATFIPPPAVLCTPFSLRLQAEITDANRYAWFINGAETFVGRTLDTLLTDPGIYDLRLVVSNQKSCRDSLEIIDAFALEPTPVANFSARVDTDPVAVGDVRFLNLSSGADVYHWSLGDGTFSDERDPLHLYESEAAYPVSLTATALFAGGVSCSESISKMVRPEFFGRFFLPTAISPESGPPQVRQWGAKGVGVATCDIRVFSPFGQQVYATDEVFSGAPTGRWNGTFPDGATPVPGGAYTWRARVTYESGRTDNLLGTVTVIR